MMISVYYRQEDEWILQKVDEICVRQRKSRSANRTDVKGRGNNQ